MVKARERVRAIRTVGVTLAVAGGLLLGVGAATPAFSSVAGTADPLRGDAVAAFIEVLVGRLVGAGQAFLVVGILLALAPGHDGGDLHDRVARAQAWVAEKRTRPRWRFAGGLALMVVALRGAHHAVDGVPLRAARVGDRRALRRHRGLPARRRAPRHRPHDPEAAQAPAGGRVRGDRGRGRVHGVRRGRHPRQQHRPTPGEPDQPGMQRVHRALSRSR